MTRYSRLLRRRRVGFSWLLILAAALIASRSLVAEAAQIEGLQAPHGFVADPSGETYFISNVNGEPDARDNNGFITKIDQNGKISHLHFIQGGRDGVVLHAPKGMAIVEDILYVVDLDTLHGFDKETGKSTVTVSFPSPLSGEHAVSLIDVASDGVAMLYVSDAAADTVYRVEAGKPFTISVLARDPALAGPSGLAWNLKTKKLIAVSWNKGKIMQIAPDGTISELVSNSFFSSRFSNLSGVDFDEFGSMYVSDFTAGKVWRIRPDMKFEVIAEYLPAPADLGIDRRNHLILVPYHYGNAAEMNGLERPSLARQKEKRSLADYGFTPPKKAPAP
jgi:DNA-binding beta-propeller fold protein YncE